MHRDFFPPLFIVWIFYIDFYARYLQSPSWTKTARLYWWLRIILIKCELVELLANHEQPIKYLNIIPYNPDWQMICAWSWLLTNHESKLGREIFTWASTAHNDVRIDRMSVHNQLHIWSRLERESRDLIYINGKLNDCRI